MNTWDQHVAAWSHPPIDDVAYLSAAELLGFSDAELRGLIERMRVARYQGWRNADNAWRLAMGLDELSGLDVLDYGCGAGLESAELAIRNRVWVADLTAVNIALATRVAALRGHPVQGSFLIEERYPFVDASEGSFDVVYCCGVLHHSRFPTAVLARFRELLRPGGQVRLLLYGPQMWRLSVGTEPPEDTLTDPGFRAFVGYCDQVGDYADWYDPTRLYERVNGLFTFEADGYIADERFYTATLRRD